MKLSFLYLLSLILVVAKIFGFLNISWLLALTPAILEIILALLIFVIAIIVAIAQDK